jgi:hypothetical protein
MTDVKTLPFYFSAVQAERVRAALMAGDALHPQPCRLVPREAPRSSAVMTMPTTSISRNASGNAQPLTCWGPGAFDEQWVALVVWSQNNVVRDLDP